MTTSTTPVALGLLVVLAGCGGATPLGVAAAEADASSSGDRDATSPSTSQSTGADAGARAADGVPTDASKAPPAAVPASDSWPEGVTPLTEAEGTELAEKCKPFTDAVTVAAKKAGRSKGSLDIARDVLTHPPSVPGVDVPRCADLMGRELAAYRARTIETEAIVSLKRIAFGMASHLGESDALCPSAPPVPASLRDVATAPYVARAEDWSAPGWACLHFDQQGPQRFVYSVHVDAQARSYEAIARGYPAVGAPPTELFIHVVVGPPGPPPNVTVMRRASTER